MKRLILIACITLLAMGCKKDESTNPTTKITTYDQSTDMGQLLYKLSKFKSKQVLSSGYTFFDSEGKDIGTLPGPKNVNVSFSDTIKNNLEYFVIVHSNSSIPFVNNGKYQIGKSNGSTFLTHQLTNKKLNYTLGSDNIYLDVDFMETINGDTTINGRAIKYSKKWCYYRFSSL